MVETLRSAVLSVWLWDEVGVIRQRCLQERSCRVLCRQLVCLSSHVQVANCVQDLRKARPSLLWFVLKGPATAGGTRKDRSRAWHVVRLVREQMTLGNHAIVEANRRSNAWDQEGLEHLQRDNRVHVTDLKWCCLGVHVDGMAIGKTTRVLATFAMTPAEQCSCSVNRVESSIQSEQLGAGAVARRVCESWSSQLETEPESSTADAHTMMVSCAQPVGPSTKGEPKSETTGESVDVGSDSVGAELASYPTEARLRQKEKERLDKQREGEKRSKRRNLKSYEKVWCDCGEDMRAIEFVSTHWREYPYDDVREPWVKQCADDERIELLCAELCDPEFTLFGQVPDGQGNMRSRHTH
eukprot:6492791-Amphidinium_carterae.1